MKRLISLLFFFSISGAQKTPEIKIRASKELFLASSFLQETGNEEFSIEYPCKPKDIIRLHDLVKCHFQEGFERVLSTFTQKRHARALLAAVLLGLQPLCDEETHEHVFDRLALLKSLFYKRLLKDKTLQEGIIPIIESNKELTDECRQKLIEMMPWRSQILATEVEQSYEYALQGYEKQCAFGVCSVLDMANSAKKIMGAFCVIRNFPPLQYSYNSSLGSNSTLIELHGASGSCRSHSHSLSHIRTFDEPIESLVSSPCGRFMAYIKSLDDCLHGGKHEKPQESFQVEVLDSKGGLVMSYTINSPVTGRLKFTPDGYLMCVSDNKFTTLDVANGEKQSEFKVPGDLTIKDFVASHDGKFVAMSHSFYDLTRGAKGKNFITLRNRSTGECIEEYRHLERIEALAFNQDGDVCAAGSLQISHQEESCNVWNMSKKKLIRDLGKVWRLFDAKCMFDPLATKILFEKTSNSISLMDLATGCMLIDLKAETRFFTSSFNHDGSQIVLERKTLLESDVLKDDLPLAQGFKNDSLEKRKSFKKVEVLLLHNGLQQFNALKKDSRLCSLQELFEIARGDYTLNQATLSYK